MGGIISRFRKKDQLTFTDNKLEVEETKPSFSQIASSTYEAKKEDTLLLSKTTEKNHFENISEELLALIFSFVSVTDLQSLLRVCQRFNKLLNNYSVFMQWMRMQSNDLKLKEQNQPFPIVYWKKLHFVCNTIQSTDWQQSEASSSSHLVVDIVPNIEHLEKDFQEATIDFWQQLQSVEVTWQKLKQDNENCARYQALTFAHEEVLSLLLLHCFPSWRLNGKKDDVQSTIIMRQTFIRHLVKKELLPNYNNPFTRIALAKTNLMLFPFMAEQDAVIWHEAIQFLYQCDIFVDIRLLLMSAMESHFKLLSQHSGNWTYAYLAARYMTLSTSNNADYITSIDYLSLTIDWMLPMISAPLFANYAAGVGKLIFSMLVGFCNNANHTRSLLTDFRPSPYVQVSSPQDAASMIHNFLILNSSGEPGHNQLPKLETLMTCMNNGYTLYSALKQYVTAEANNGVEEDNVHTVSFELC